MSTRKKLHRSHKVYAEPGKGKYPMIRFTGKYLQSFGFEIGDTVSITFSKNDIRISKNAPK